MQQGVKKLQMVDLIGQYEKIQVEIDAAVLNVIRSSAYINGPEVKAFQAELEKFLGVKNVIPCGNGTDALQISMMALGLKAGDEVIAPDFSYAAIAEVIALLGLTPILVDVSPDIFNIDVQAIKKAITPKTKAIVPVHLFGQCAEMSEIMALAKEHNLYVIEDAAQAIGAEYNGAKAGTIGHVGCTSFFPSKNLGCFGDGGAIFTNDDELAKKMRMIANHGQSVQYQHDVIGINSRLDSIQAAVLRVKLRHLNEFTKARQLAASIYDKAFANNPKIKIPARSKNSTHVFHQYTIQVDEKTRNELKEHLSAKGIPAMIYYPKPLHLQKAYHDSRYKERAFPVTEHLCKTVLSLPMHTELNADTVHYIADSVLEFLK